MRSFPIAYRRGRSLQGGRIPADPGPPLGFGPFAATAVAAWAFTNLATQLAGWSPVVGAPDAGYFNQNPAAYGWTSTIFCRAGGQTKVAGFLNCLPGQVVGQASWEAPGGNPLTATSLNYWYPWARFNDALNRYEQCIPHSRWVKNAPTGRVFSLRSISTPLPQGVPARLPVLWARALTIMGMRDRGYSVREYPFGIHTGARPPLGVDVLLPPAVIPTPTVRYSDATETVARARAVPAALTREIKMSPNTAAGRMWMGVYASLNFLGAAWGLTRALHRAIPRAHRRRSKRLGSMLQDIYAWAGVMNFLPRSQRDAYMMAAGANMAVWTANRWAYGKAGAGLFTTQSFGPGGEALARSWATFDSGSRSTQYRLRQTADRRQSDVRW